MTYNFTKYTEFIKNIDTVSTKIEQFYDKHITCKLGCSSCCIAGLTVSPIEAYYIRENIELNKPVTQSKPAAQSNDSCIFLNNDSCLIYQFRPLICRTQGLPLLYQSLEGDSDGFELSLCELNFTEYTEDSLDNNHILNMETANHLLMNLNIEFLKEYNLFEELQDRRFALDELL